MKKLLSLLLALTMLVGTFTVAVSANELGTIVFINVADNTIVNRLDGVDSLYANVSFIANETGTASVMAAHYDIETGVLTAMEFINTLETTEGEVVEYSTPAIDVAETDLLKVFAWDEDSLAPLAAVGTIDRLLLEDLPTATVTGLDTDDIADVDLTFAMNFKADPVTDAQLAYYSNWYADYELTLNKDVTFNMDGTKDGYLAGQYDSWSPAWVTVPKKDVTVAAGESVKIMETAAETYGKPGLKYTYGEVYSRVKDFDCGVYFTPEFLAANNGLEATLVLKMYNPANEAESYVIGVPYTFSWTLPTATVTEIDVSAIEDVALDFALNFKADSVNEDQIAMFADWYADYELTVNKTVTFNADGTADGFLSGQYDAWSENWLSVPTADATLDANTPVRVMETAAALMGQSGLKLTCEDIFTFVKDFNCGLAFAPEFLVANPDLEVKLSLKIYNPANEEEFYIIGEEYIYTPETIPSIDKFIAKEGVSYNHTLETAEAGTTTFNFEDLFTVIGGVPVDMENLTVTGATYADGKVTVDGFGAKTITVTDNYYCNTVTVTVMVNEPANVDKFTGKAVTKQHTLFTYENGVVTATLDELFTNNGYAVKEVTVGGDGTYADGVVSFAGTGTFTVTITDNFYCNVATATVVVNAPIAVDKFVGNDVTYTHTLDTIEGNTATFDFAELFTAIEGVPVKEITVEGATYADGKITVEGIGTFTITATDNFFCNTAIATVTVKEPASVDKFIGWYRDGDHTLETVKSGVYAFDFDRVFTVEDGAIVDWDNITVTGATYEDGKLLVEGFGEKTITITDNFYCNVATATVKVNEPHLVNKFTPKFITVTHTLDTIESGVYTVDFEDVFGINPDYPLGNIIVEGAIYEDGKITVEGLGTIEVTVYDDFYAFPCPTTITVYEPDSVDKFFGKDVVYTHTLDTIEDGVVTYTFEELFDVDDTYPIKAITVGGDGTFENGVFTFEGTGDFVVTATDNFYCNEAEAYVTVFEPENVNKFTGKAVTYTHTLDTIEANTVTYDFADLFANNGYAVKDITVTGGTYADGKITVSGLGTHTITATDNFYCNEATATITVKAPSNVTKWTATNKTVNLTVTTVGQNQTFNFSDLFTAVNGAYIKTATVTVNNGGNYANGVITVPGKAGTYTVTATDNFYCNPVSATITVKDAANVDKFTGKNVTYTHTLDTIEANTVTYNFADLFTTNSAYPVKTITVTGGTYANGKITVTGIGTFTVTATDNYYCNTATATVTVKAPSNVTKWTAKSGLAYETDKGVAVTKTLGELFSANGNKIKDANVTVTGATFTKGATWDKGTVTFNGAGTYTVTITDGFYCDATSATVTITEIELEPVQKFSVKDEYYVQQHSVVNPGSSDTVTVKLGDIFQASGEGDINSANVSVSFSDKVRKIEATYNKNSSDWTQSTITLKYSGEVTVTITDGDGCIASETIVATTPKWVGDVDAGDASSIAQVHYGTKTKTSLSSAIDLAAGKTGKLVLYNIPADGVYGIQWRNGYGVSGTPGTAKFTVNGYSNTSTVIAPNWSDADGTDFVLYLTKGTNTITVENVGTTWLSVYGSVNAMSLDKSGYDDEDFLPLLKDNGFTSGGDTPTEPSDPSGDIPPAASWDSLGWIGSIKHQPEFSSWEMSDDPADITLEPGEGTVYTTKSGTYTGVYGMQLCIGSVVNTTVKIVTADGYWNEYIISKASWTSGMDQDQPIYLHAGTNQIYIENTGNQTVTITEFDFGGLNKDGNCGMKYIDLVGTGATFPN